jgi:tetratricopeptide repeat protein 7
LLKLEAGSELKTWFLIARIMSAQKRYEDAECIVDAALDQAGKRCHGDLLQTKARIQIAQGQFKKAIETYTHLLAVIQLRTKGFDAGISVLQVSTFYCSTLYVPIYLNVISSDWKFYLLEKLPSPDS